MKVKLNYVTIPEEDRFIEMYQAVLALYPEKSCNGDLTKYAKLSFANNQHPTPIRELGNDGVMKLTEYSRKAIEAWLAESHPGYYVVVL